jgi:hypothetical protein
MAVPNAAALLDQFTAAGIAVEVTHRSERPGHVCAVVEVAAPGVRRRGEAEKGRPISETRRLWLTPLPPPLSRYRHGREIRRPLTICDTIEVPSSFPRLS